jgi:hypothetical protein
MNLTPGTRPGACGIGETVHVHRAVTPGVR